MGFITKLKFIRALWLAIKDPRNTDSLIECIDQMAEKVDFTSLIAKFKGDPQTLSLLKNRTPFEYPRLDLLKQFPPQTLGYELAQYYIRNGFEPEFYPLPEESEKDFIRSRIRKTHDILHTVTDFKTDIEGELGLLGFMNAQFQAPPTVLLIVIGLVHGLLYKPTELPQYMSSLVRGWNLGSRTPLILGIQWDFYYSWPLQEVQRKFGFLSEETTSSDSLNANSKKYAKNLDERQTLDVSF